ncbi:AarF/UbiB family protein [Methylovulum psychrotolerans]|uniref:ABC transporter n=1 Tax=Methylovulum psychrotolerans TaxID=1704499 RepID=A0A1Z4BXR4_9GAMM|nr:AarF/UbiB family protein [Methylovulum psychrotolerans]ASF46051.1 ABC transporter [Methylovulum psychrotolerans]
MIPRLLNKTLHWYRIALAMRRLKRVDSPTRRHAQQTLALLLADSRGLAMKIGQVMAGSADNNAFQTLVTSIEPLPLTAVQNSLGKPLAQALQAIEESVAAASLGQVHRALLHNGTEVAIKIRYPGIVGSIKAELKLSAWLPSVGPLKRWQFNVNDYKTILHRQLLRETDYRLEMHTQQRFQQTLSVPGLFIPPIYPEFCSEAVLVQAWATGSRFSEACTWSKQHRLEIGRTLLMLLWQSLFVHGEVHGDPHPGNYLFRLNPQGNAETVLLDYGCTVVVAPPRRLALLKLMDAYHSGQPIDAFRCFVAMGFNAEKLAHLQVKMPGLCQILLRPFLSPRPFQMQEWQLSTSLQALLGEQRWWFRAAGPADLMLLLRAFHGVSQQLAQLDVALPWWPLLQNVVGQELLAQARAFELPPVSADSRLSANSHSHAQRLCIRMTEHGNTVIAMDLPAETAADLESIIPLSVREQIAATTTVDVAGLSRRLQREGIVPQELFSVRLGQQHCRVWLE